MSINSYVPQKSNVLKLNITNTSYPTSNTNIVSSSNNAYGTPYMVMSLQKEVSVFNVYICVSAAVSLIVQRYIVSSAQTGTETFPAETANQPNWHSFEVSDFEQIQLQLSGTCTIKKLTVFEPSPG